MIRRTFLLLIIAPLLPPTDREAVYLRQLSDKKEHEKLDKLITAINKSRAMMVQADGLPPESRRSLYRECAAWLEHKAGLFKELAELK